MFAGLEREGEEEGGRIGAGGWMSRWVNQCVHVRSVFTPTNHPSKIFRTF